MYDDPNNDGEPWDMVLLSSENATITENTGQNIFEEVVLSSPVEVNGSFFVAILMAELYAGTETFPYDSDNPVHRSWVARSSWGNMDPGNVQGTADGYPLSNLDEVVQANLMVRATGTEVP